jgi:DNA-binding transcriptional ArsR family regulator
MSKPVSKTAQQLAAYLLTLTSPSQPSTVLEGFLYQHHAQALSLSMSTFTRALDPLKAAGAVSVERMGAKPPTVTLHRGLLDSLLPRRSSLPTTRAQPHEMNAYDPFMNSQNDHFVTEQAAASRLDFAELTASVRTLTETLNVITALLARQVNNFPNDKPKSIGADERGEVAINPQRLTDSKQVAHTSALAILNQLVSRSGSKTAAAAACGISEATVRRKLKGEAINAELAAKIKSALERA